MLLQVCTQLVVESKSLRPKCLSPECVLWGIPIHVLVVRRILGKRGKEPFLFLG